MKMGTSSATIMIVDDMPANLYLLGEILRGEGYAVVEFERGMAALQAATQDPPDLIFLDIVMPEMDGFEVCRLLRHHTALRDVPVIFISASTDIENKVRAFAEGGWDYIAKPFEHDEVLARVRTHLELSAARREIDRHRSQLEEKVRLRTDYLLQAQRLARIGAWKIDIQADRIEWIGETNEIFGFPPDSAPSFEESLENVHPLDRPRILERWRRAISAPGIPYDIEYRIVVDGRESWLHEKARVEFDAGGNPVRALGTIQDISGRKAHETELESQRRKWLTAIEGAQAGAWEIDVATGAIAVDASWAALFGYQLCDLQPLDLRTWKQLAHPDEVDTAMAAFRLHLSGQRPTYEAEYRIRHKDRRWIWVRSVGRVISRDESGAPLAVAGIDIDITQQKQHLQQLEFVARHDEFTGLPNRRFLSERLNSRLGRAVAGERLALAYIDVDGLSILNETYGQDVGDKVIKGLANRLSYRCGDGNVARTGGDEFACVLDGLEGDAACTEIVELLMQELSRPIPIEDGQAIAVSASVGVTVYPQRHEVDAEQLLRQADQAMYQAKLAGKSRYVFFDTEREELARQTFGRIEEIRQALADDQFMLYFQPKVNLRSGQVLGFEALVRWRHPEKGLVRPGEFIPYLDNHPLSIALGDRVIEMALEQLERWNLAGLRTRVSVNVDAMQLHDPNFLERLLGQLAAVPGVSRAQLELEILETGAMRDMPHVSALVRQLDKLGIAVALDDFGTGFSSMTFLKQLAASTIKIDQSFVRDLLNDAEHAVIINSIRGLGQSFRREVVVEGVETEIHGALLIELGCELGQGYAISRPMPAESVEAWIAGWRVPDSWAATTALEPVQIPDLLAELHHRAWRAACKDFVDGRSKDMPSAECRRCELGRWLADPATAQRLGGLPDYAAALEKHREFHAAAQELLVSSTGAHGPSFAGRDLDEVYAVSNALLDHLKALRQPARV